MFWIPLPWCTSQSRIMTRSAPCVSRAYLAATATLLKMQKPQASSSSAWWPGGRMTAAPQLAVESPSNTASTTFRRLPQERSALSSEDGFYGLFGQ